MILQDNLMACSGKFRLFSAKNFWRDFFLMQVITIAFRKAMFGIWELESELLGIRGVTKIW
jgi:hypothetical protein